MFDAIVLLGIPTLIAYLITRNSNTWGRIAIAYVTAFVATVAVGALAFWYLLEVAKVPSAKEASPLLGRAFLLALIAPLLGFYLAKRRRKKLVPKPPPIEEASGLGLKRD